MVVPCTHPTPFADLPFVTEELLHEKVAKFWKFLCILPNWNYYNYSIVEQAGLLLVISEGAFINYANYQ